MRTIASTTELLHELSQILDYTQGEKPSRRRIARDLRALSQRVASLSYPMRVENLQSVFVGECGHELYTWLSGLHQQLARSFDNVSGFQNWDYGDPQSNGGVWSIRVYLKDSPVFQTLAGDPVRGNLNLELKFESEVIHGTLVSDNRLVLMKKTFHETESTPGVIAAYCGGVWKKYLIVRG